MTPFAAPCNDAIGFDCNTKLTVASARIAAAMGFKFATRYVGISHPNPGDIDVNETQIILGEIGALWVVQHVLNPGWSPSMQLGQSHGQAAVRNAQLAGYIGGAVLWQDLEGILAGTSGQAVIDYCGAYGTVLLAEGYLHGLYDGFNAILSASQLYHSLPTVRTYWAASPRYTLPVRGFAKVQVVEDFTPRALGFPIDIDMCGEDALGDRPMWMRAA